MSQLDFVENILFDFDGTIVDSPKLHEKSFINTLLENYPSLISLFNYTSVMGLSTPRVFESLGLTAEVSQKLTKIKREKYLEMVSEGHLNLMPGASEFLSYAKLGAKKVILATSGAGASVISALQSLNLGDFFDNIVTSCDVSKGKPDPDIFNLALDRNSLNSSRTVVIEDSYSGVIAARRSGLKSIGVYNRQIQNEANFFFDSLADLQASKLLPFSHG